jgi:hypothetical protein
VVHRSGEWLGAEAARRLATRDRLEVARPYDVEVVGLLGYVELHPPLTEAEIARLQDRRREHLADDATGNTGFSAGRTLARGFGNCV